ncbi:ran guanine nucleotide release factor [Acipenser ruthenus]|uniref:ran guanine nucleotide release factor n=1 Tax=Acipenser ruthenus TaxID=7906 RepID=UPI00274068BB|nr:ran guanine nucleotide release factor [Acipenser ruthenus]
MQSNGTDAHPLFGGAFSAVLPPGFRDVSELREIPDNQEVFAHSHTDQSIIVELLEYQGHVTGRDAARYHFEDVACSNEAAGPGGSQVLSVEPLPAAQTSLQESESAWLLHGTQLVSKFNEEAENAVSVYLGLFRLPQYSTDALVTFNDPVTINPLSSSAVSESGQDAVPSPWSLEQFRLLLQTLRLLNPDVFG